MNLSKAYTHELSAMDMCALMASLGLDRLHAIGQSSGAMTLTHMATVDSTRITAMILVAKTTHSPEEARSRKAGVTYEDWKVHMEPHHPGGEEQIRMLVDQLRHFKDTYDDMNFTPLYLSKIVCPTLIIHGDREGNFPVYIPVTMYDSIPNSYLWIVPNDGHIPIGIYNRNSVWSEVFLKVAEDFLAGRWEQEE